jgi:hypothetical protein
MKQARLGIDIGRVIIDGSSHPAGGDTAFFAGDEATMLATPEMAGAFDAIRELCDRFGGRVWLVSKCGPRVQARTLRWLDRHRFAERTGVAPDQVRFCRIRAEKRRHCEELFLTHFIDDRTDVHEAIRGTVEFQYFFGHRTAPAYGYPAPDWPTVRRLVRASIDQSDQDT